MLADGAREIRCRPVLPDIEPLSRDAQCSYQTGPALAVAEHVSHPAIIVLEELKQAAQHEQFPRNRATVERHGRPSPSNNGMLRGRPGPASDNLKSSGITEWMHLKPRVR